MMNQTSPTVAGEPAVSVSPATQVHSLLVEDAPPRAGRAFAAMAFCLLLCAWPLYVALGTRDTIHTMENISLMSSQETWLRQWGWHDIPAEKDAWLVPSQNARPRYNKPPLVVWVNMLMWSDLTPAGSTVEQLTFRSRLASATMGMVMLAGVFWIGLSLGNLRTAMLSTLVAGSIWFFQRQARNASYDVYLVAWATMAIAAALWAMRPWKASPSLVRTLGGWALAGVFLGLSILSKGALAIVITVIPLILMMAILRDRWKSAALGLAILILAAAAVAAPWYIHIEQTFPRSTQTLASEYGARRAEFQTPFYYLALVALVWPWSVYLIASLFHPFKLARGARGKQVFIAWAWFLFIFIFFSIPGAKEQRYILPILPAAALMAVQVWQDHQKLEETGGHDPGMIALVWPHWLGMIAVAAMIGPFLAMQQWMVDHQWADQQPIGQLSLWAGLPISAALLAIALMGLRRHLQCRIASAMNLSVAWALIFSSTILYAYTCAPHGIHPIKADCQRVAAILGDAPLRYLQASPDEVWPNEEFAFFSRRIAFSIKPDQLDDYKHKATADHPVYIMADITPQHDHPMLAAGFAIATTFYQDRDRLQNLWRFPAPEAAASNLPASH
ncbi:MAG: hypothetical protein IT440_04795 [Phycisphaeraceae bacterium]|nr:hypothetical protein [Phycisphaeraceae bacterium]